MGLDLFLCLRYIHTYVRTWEIPAMQVDTEKLEPLHTLISVAEQRRGLENSRRLFLRDGTTPVRRQGKNIGGYCSMSLLVRAPGQLRNNSSGRGSDRLQLTLRVSINPRKHYF